MFSHRMIDWVIFAILPLLLLKMVTGEWPGNNTVWHSCSPYCNCSLTDYTIMAKCDLQMMDKCENFVLPNNTMVLDLSKNNFVEVPSCVLNKSKSISTLILLGNNIGVIEEGTFPLMPNLLRLDLSFNDLREWRGDITNTLPSLRSVDLTGNHIYFPDNNLFEVHKLKEIRGITWNVNCADCTLVNTELLVSSNDSDMACIVTPEEYFFSGEIEYGRSLLFVRRGFSPQCLCESDSCIAEEIFMPYILTLNKLPRKLFYTEYILGATAVILNLVVMFISFGCRSLRTSTSFLLLGNIGVCDIFMGVYSILIARYTVYELIVNKGSYTGMDVFVNDYCTLMGVIFTTAQIVSVSSSLLATVERYLSIVHCMKPGVRLRKTTALKCLAGIWSVAIAYSLLPVFRVGGLRYHGEFTCMMPFVNGPDQQDTSEAGLTVAALLVLFFVMSIALYIHIFFYVIKAGISAGVKRKATLAKNISIMVFTNFIFFISPMVCTLLFVYRFEQLQKAFKINTLRSLKIYFIMLSWAPVVFISLNSCLNPFLCAFRHPKFRKEVKSYFEKLQCSFLRRSHHNLPQVWTLAAAKRLELTSTDAVVGNENVSCETYRSLETLN
ncbi:leucine-rich repeat-containing G-protein coupled receptor 4-like [Stylophora pistillata]|uniref:leucine-rich repeat-containing G-protein coupled receptor 4-like n=1 Tax=Stylophora pistillata TaxID=50429 RepID=UPI000C04C095|nr:leucine-rich repeat-containing G-protein coupled receptor 4-like [Stylophora pistillata]